MSAAGEPRPSEPAAGNSGAAAWLETDGRRDRQRGAQRRLGRADHRFDLLLHHVLRPEAAGAVGRAGAAEDGLQEGGRLRAADQQMSTTYGAANPATKSVRIPIERAMDLIASEAARPAPAPGVAPATVPAPVAVTAPAAPAATTPRPEPKPETAAAKAATPAPEPEAVAAKSATPPAPTAPAAPTPAPAPTPTPAQAPAAVAALPPPGAARGSSRRSSFMCSFASRATTPTGRAHSVVGVQTGMAQIPDFTDPKWQLSRTNADFVKAMIEGKGQGMKPVKDKLDLSKLQPEEMADFIRSFSP